MIDFRKQARNSETNAALHRLMNMAAEAPADKAKRAWCLVLKGVIVAIGCNEYHSSVHERFIEECSPQFKDIHFRLRKELGLPEPKLGQPLRKGRKERKVYNTTQRRAVQTVAAAINAAA